MPWWEISLRNCAPESCRSVRIVIMLALPILSVDSITETEQQFKSLFGICTKQGRVWTGSAGGIWIGTEEESREVIVVQRKLGRVVQDKVAVAYCWWWMMACWRW
ncbi:hypothetical protein XENORESO_012325 [Xenotaenia resolanae]|uniref:Uncharacterized protein n=1 Tax=Xenotaenia resolanae TaxID=208358 RepID=A0ABV0VYX2_9TELE